ncbi:hypothetical protein [Myroides odoratimimus]|uniref:hypothetical protein n=1 Tax=Myroides odoratimimus TaxID=76832 RepID=UPI002DBD6437|nr:hypothetical protein [Myroides odoratimimus]MEC4044101.1 hypothetical protein [Myroides odoratimimus]MEC4151944.1 hypothetical protein [Myroides odoratimimus]
MIDLNKKIDGEVDEVIFLETIEKAKKVISNSCNINMNEIQKITDENITLNLDKRGKVNCRRIIFSFNQGSLDCYLSVNNDFIEIIHHPK